jgi:hypothetical protein
LALRVDTGAALSDELAKELLTYSQSHLITSRPVHQTQKTTNPSVTTVVCMKRKGLNQKNKLGDKTNTGLILLKK